MRTDLSHRLSRRALLSSAAAGCVLHYIAPGSGANSGWAADAGPDGWIDAHSHVWCRDLGRYPLAGGQSVDVLQPPEFTPEQLLALGRPEGVGRYVLIQHKPHHGLDNSYLADAIRQHTGVFSGVACVAAEGPDPAADMRRLAKLGFRGYRIRPGEGGTPQWRDSPGMAAMWRCAAESGLAICPLINPEDLGEVDVMCQRYPETTVVIDHFARIGVDGVVRPEDVATLAGLARHRHVNVKVSAFYALGRKQPPHEELVPMVRRLYETYGAGRLMWGTDCPYQLSPPNTYATSLQFVRERLDFLSAEDRTALLRGTAARVFFGPAAV